MLRDSLRVFRRTRRELSPALLGGATPDGTRLRVVGASAEFALAGPLPTGWVEFSMAIGPAQDRPGQARVIVETDAGPQAVPLPLERDGKAATVVRLPGLVRGLRLQIDRPGPFEPPILAVRELAPAEGLARIAAPVLAGRLRERWLLPRTLWKLARTLGNGGGRAVADRLLDKEISRSARGWYAEWRLAYAALTAADRQRIQARSASLSHRFSLLMPVAAETKAESLARSIASVRAQLHPHWELCILDAASPHTSPLHAAAAQDARIRMVSGNGVSLQAALEQAAGDFVVLLDSHDQLAEHALYLFAEELAAHPETDLVYGDGDSIDGQGRHFDPDFKPDWNPDLLLSHDYIGDACAFRRSRILEAGAPFEVPQGSLHGLRLRLGSKGRVRHVPFVVHHSGPERRPPGEAATAGTVQAVQEFVGPEVADVEPGPLPATCRLHWPIAGQAPLVSVIVPTRDARSLLEVCVESLIRTTAYRNYELLVVDNQSRAPEALAYLAELEGRGAARILRYDQPFNFSAVNNLAVREAHGAVVALLNNDVEIVDPGWLQEMVSQALRPGIGAVGARLFYPDRTVQHGGVILGLGGVAAHAHRFATEREAGYRGRARLVQDVSAVTAACLVIRREAYLEVGGLDESLAVAFNDVDFCLRVRQKGLRNLWTPFATLLHHESKSRGADDTRAKRRRFQDEEQRMLARWGEALRNDPAYNPNLTLEAADFSLAWPPRVRKPWERTA
jgi:GT2 family glycosyltransferase